MKRSATIAVLLTRLSLTGLLLAGLLLACSLQEESSAQSAVFATERGAIDGADPVAFFSEGTAVRGSPELWLDWNGARWHFDSERNRELFRSDPERYAPQFGGYCAYGVASGYAVKSEPEAWSLLDGKLYLNYDLETRAEWSQDRSALIAQAKKNWPGVLD